MKKKKMLKKLMAVLCCLSCILAFRTNVFAMDTENITVTQEMKDGIEAYVVNENGEKEDLDCEISLKKNISITRSADDLYTLKVTVSENKSSHGEKEEDGIRLTGVINWIDRPGTNNMLTSVAGRFDNTSKIAHAYYQYGTLHQWETSKVMDFSKDHTFNEYHTMEALGFRLEMNARTKNDVKVLLAIKTSIFD